MGYVSEVIHNTIDFPLINIQVCFGSLVLLLALLLWYIMVMSKMSKHVPKKSAIINEVKNLIKQSFNLCLLNLR